MASSDCYEFLCPQFCDFTIVDSSPKNADTLGGFSPDLTNPGLNILAQSVSRRKVYPDLKKKGALLQKTPICHSTTKTNSAKCHFLTLSKRCSRSDGALNCSSRNRIASAHESTHFSTLKHHNRSLSENDIRTKARTCPATPMCLKRTLCRTKARKWKTSEELELEKIAQLQKQTRERLRANEIAMKRLKMKTRPCIVPKEFKKIEIKSINNHLFNIPKVTVNKIAEKQNGLKLNSSPPSTRKGIDINTCRAERAKRFKSSVNEFREFLCKPISESNQCIKQNLNQSAASMSHADELTLIKTNKLKPYPAHSGLIFHPNNRKTTELFSCSGKKSRVVPSTTPERDISMKDQRDAPGTHYKHSGKENVFLKSFSDVKRVKDLNKRMPTKSNRI